jgi:tartrate dehydratase alpha subunit/fumarate hydratase class I-like protein
MKPLISVVAFVFVLGFSSPTHAAQPSTENPSDAIRSFYRWYVTELIANRNPMENRKELKRFATERLLKEIDKMKKGPDGLGGDYFVDAQDFDNLWAKNITVSDLKVSGRNATAEVLLAGKGEMRRRLKVNLVSDGTAWKVDKVQGRE